MGFLGIGTFGGVSGHVILGRYLWKKGMEGRNEGGKEFTVPFSTFSLRPALLVCWCTPLPTSPQADHGSEGAGRERLHGQQMPGVLGSLPSQAAVVPGSSVRGIFQARILEWIAIVFSKGFS